MLEIKMLDILYATSQIANRQLAWSKDISEIQLVITIIFILIIDLSVSFRKL